MEAAGELTTLSSPAASRNYASRIQQQEKDSEKQMNAIYGPKCLEQFEKLSPNGSWAKTFSELLIGMGDWYSRRCKLTWKLKGTKYNRLYFRLQASTPPTKEIGSDLLLTPNTMEISKDPNHYRTVVKEKNWNTNTKYTSLSSQIQYAPKWRHLFPTPQSRDWKGPQGRSYKGEAHDLPGIVGKSFQLNPLFVTEMMGYPIDWLVLPFQDGEKKL